MTSPSPNYPHAAPVVPGSNAPMRPQVSVPVRSGPTRVRRTTLQNVRDILICLASLCAIFLTGMVLYTVLSFGRALSQVVNAVNPAPVVACSPTPDWPCE